MTETELRFLRAVSERVASDRVAEVYLFPALRQGPVDSGVAVVAEGEASAECSDGIARPGSRFAVYRATYRHTVKGPDRGAWSVEVSAEADAPLEAVFAVVRGVQRRSAVAAEPDKLTGDEFRAIVGATASEGAADGGIGGPARLGGASARA